jgi:hypothetical protein
MAAARENFTPFVVRVPMNHARALWLHFGTVRYAFPLSRFFNSLRARFVPVRSPLRRYGTVHPSIRGCTRTTPVPTDPYRLVRARLRATTDDTATAGPGGAGYTIGTEPVTAGARQ